MSFQLRFHSGCLYPPYQPMLVANTLLPPLPIVFLSYCHLKFKYNAGKARWSRYLWAVKQQCLSLDKCDVLPKADKASYLCVGDQQNPHNTECFRDGGGPLTYTYGKETILFGVLHGHGKETRETLCRDVDLFCRVSEPFTLNWIKNKIEEYH